MAHGRRRGLWGYSSVEDYLFGERGRDNQMRGLLRQFATIQEWKKGREQQEWQRGMEVGLVVNDR